MKVVSVVGARPNLMKMAPLLWEMKRQEGIKPLLVHTGQHYDAALTDIFFRQLDLPAPNYHLGVGSGSHSYQTAHVMLKLEQLLQQISPDLVLVVGDVNSTLAAALVAAKLQIPIAHVEAGLRSFDRTMPEEINRLLTDAVASYLFVTEPSGVENLRREGLEQFLQDGAPIEEVSPEIMAGRGGDPSAPPRWGAFVGNVMIDTLQALRERAETEAQVEIPDGPYALVTLHRPSNVDEPRTLGRIIQALSRVAQEIPLLFPCHPRTRKRLQEFGLDTGGILKTGPHSGYSPNGSISLLEPLGYLEFLKLMAHARLVFTDSGGIQEESTILGIPCLTLRENTERPITLTVGTNRLVGTDPEKIFAGAEAALSNRWAKWGRPPLWDGKAAQRIVKILRLTKYFLV